MMTSQTPLHHAQHYIKPSLTTHPGKWSTQLFPYIPRDKCQGVTFWFCIHYTSIRIWRHRLRPTLICKTNKIHNIKKTTAQPYRCHMHYCAACANRCKTRSHQFDRSSWQLTVNVWFWKISSFSGCPWKFIIRLALWYEMKSERCPNPRNLPPTFLSGRILICQTDRTWNELASFPQYTCMQQYVDTKHVRPPLCSSRTLLRQFQWHFSAPQLS